MMDGIAMGERGSSEKNHHFRSSWNFPKGKYITYQFLIFYSCPLG